MLYLDYPAKLRSELGAMRVFSFSQFGHSLDYDITSERGIRVYFKTEEEQSFFAMYWAGINNR